MIKVKFYGYSLWARIIGFKFISTAVKPENGYSIRLIKK